MKRFWKDKRGSSLVLVMICMAFLILLAGAVITTTITNIRLKSSQKKTQENFYQTDTILDAISAGIQNESSAASAKAYETALGSYNASLTAANNSVDTKYTTEFLNGMLEVLTGGTGYDPSVTSYKYLDSVLEGYLTDAQIGFYVEHSDENGDPKGVIDMDGDSIILRDVTVKKEHDQDKTYETTLTTDIRIEVPSVTTEAHSEYLSYAILADDQIVADNGAINPEVKGSMYSGTVNRTGDESTKAGIVISGGAGLTINAAYIITRGDVAVSNSSTLSISKDSVAEYAQLWAENILTSGTGSGNDVTIDAQTFVADDLEINGDYDLVTLKGWYYGYNFTDDYSALSSTGSSHVKLSENSSYSSSISVNGYNDRLVMNGLEQLVLAGRTFISKKANAGETLPETDALGNTLPNPDIELGESLAVKSSQLAYFVSALKDGSTDGFVKKVDDMKLDAVHMTAVPGFGTFDNDTKEGISCYYFTVNGTTYLFDYLSYENRLGIPKDASGNKQLDIAKYITDGDLDPNEPLKLYARHDESVSQSAIRYFYLNFADSKTSSKFYDLFYNQSTQQTIYDAVNKTYVDAVGIYLGDNKEIMLSSGNLMYSDQNDVDATDGKAKIKVKLENPDIDPTKSFTDFAKKKNKIYMSRQLALVEYYTDAVNSSRWRLYDDSDTNRPDNTLNKSGKSDHTNLFDRLVDRSKLTGTQIGSYSVQLDNGSVTNCGYIVSDGDVEWPNDYTAQGYSESDPCFILAEGNVTVKGSTFKGLIIAGDNVELATSVKVTSNEEAVEKLMEADKTSAAPKFYNVMSKYFRKSVDATIGGNDEDTDVNNVTYENWKKND